MKLPIKCFGLLDGILVLYSVPVLCFILSIFGYLDDYTDYNYKFNVYAYFKSPYTALFIFFIICTILLIIYFIKRKIRIVTISIAKKYIVTGSESDVHILKDINGNKYVICWKVYDFLEGNEVIEVKIEDDDIIIQVLNIIKQGERRNT